VVRIPVEQGHSTTTLIERTRRGPTDQINFQLPTANLQSEPESPKPKA
jgi:hypothetical protein